MTDASYQPVGPQPARRTDFIAHSLHCENKHFKMTTQAVRGGDFVGHPFQTNPQLDDSKTTLMADKQHHVNSKKNHDAPPMKGAAWISKHKVEVQDRPRPTITDPEDVVLRVTSTCICGSDLHLYEGYMAGMQKNDLMGHEFMGIVEEVGPEVTKCQKGDRVVVCFDIGCGKCAYCKAGMFSSCETTNPSGDMEALYGHRCAGFFGYSHMTGGYEGGQAEYVRVPFANTNTLKVPNNMTDEQVVLLSDILPTAWHANEMGEVGPGRTVAIWGAGPVGILAAMCAVHRGASKVVIIDRIPYRLEHAAKIVKGVHTIDYSKADPYKELKKIFHEFSGPDTCIEAVGFHYAKTLVHTVEQKLALETDPSDVINELIKCGRKGGCVSIVGAYAALTNHFNIGAFMEKGMTMRGGQTPVQRYWHMLLQKIQEGSLDPSQVITHILPLEQASEAYKIFNEKKDNCIKVVLKPASARPGLEPATAPA